MTRGKQKSTTAAAYAVCGGALLIRIFVLSKAKMKNPDRCFGNT
jgi:hypothetical protein